MPARNFFTDIQQKSIVDAIKKAESRTSGEIRVQLDSRCKGDVLDRAAYVFEQLDMHKTALRNGVLFYLATEDRKFAILGDAGINLKVPEGFWDDIRDKMRDAFSRGEFAEGLCTGIEMAGIQLSKYFPHAADDINELPDGISFDGNIKEKNSGKE